MCGELLAPTAFAATGTGGGEALVGVGHDEVALEFGDGGQPPVNHAAFGGDGVDALLQEPEPAAAGVGAKEFIDRRVVLEAKRLLVHEEDPINQAADRLGFDDASNFVKYFTQRTGVTPSAFRHHFRAG